MSAEMVSQEFERLFGESPAIVTTAPGRVNLIGEHTDYNDGYVFPAAIDRFVWVAASPSDQQDLHSIELGSGEPGSWAKYPEGVAYVLRAMGHDVPALKAVVTSDVPIGSGVSSSAALELAFGVAFNELANLQLSRECLARVGQRCENEFVGVQTGLMDQMASAMGKAGHAMSYDTRTGELMYAAIPPGLAIVVADTTKARALAGSKYNERRAECERACSALGVPSLRDADLDLLASHEAAMEDVIFRRARHVISENQRCVEFRGALDQGEMDLVGSLMRQSHESLRDDYEVSCPELDAMAASCWSAPGCVGARMTGAGFGGACVALVDERALLEFLAETAAHYNSKTGIEGQFIVCKAADGARRVR